MTPKELKTKAQRMLNRRTQKGVSLTIRDEARGWDSRGVIDYVEVFRVGPVYDSDGELIRVRYLVGMFSPFFWEQTFRGARLYTVEEIVEEERQLVLKTQGGRDYILGNIADENDEASREDWLQYLKSSEGRELRELALDQFRHNYKEEVEVWQ